MKKIFNRVKDWCIEYKEDIKTCYMFAVTVIVVIIGIFTCAVVAMCNDLVGIVETRNNEIEGYLDDIEYLESVIYELRTQYEKECKTNN